MFTTLRARVFAGFLFILMLLAGLAGYAIYSLASLADVTSASLEKNAEQSLAASSMYESLVRIDQAELRMLAADTADAGPAMVEEPAHFYYALTKAWTATDAQDSASPLLNDIEVRWSEYKGHLDYFYTLALHDPPKARRFYEDTLEHEIDTLKGKNISLQDLNFNAFESAKSQEKARARGATLGVILVAAIALLVGIAGSYEISRRTVRPLMDLTDRVKELRAGHLEAHVPIRGADEISDLGFEFNRLTERLREFEAMNVSEIVREKQKSEAIIESIDDPLLLFDAGGKLILMNKAAETITGRSEQLALGESLRSLFSNPKVLKDIEQALEYAARSLHGARKDESELMLTSQPPIVEIARESWRRYFRIRVARIVAAGSQSPLAGVLVLFTDITHFKRLDQMKSDFIAKVSHEFRTPLTSMTMSLDILGDELVGSINPEQRDIIETSKHDAKRLSKLIRDLLMLARLESAKEGEAKEEIDLAETVEQLVRSMQPQYNERHVHLMHHRAPEGRFEIAREDLTSILANLLSNALKYTPAGGEVSVSVEWQAHVGCIVLEVRDTGVGIAPEDRARIFEKFFQIKHRDMSTPGSVGLGLAIVREIADRYNGSVAVESAPGKGSTFTVQLHVRRVKESAEQQV
ncbi:MAG: ATP-binding protein [Bacteroidota bacterium]|nr:ATP-binding protein [Bacteroidota bacterium]MDP4232348.1 ATP-binding protein [Bacteroidota bacterium]MDP4241487.1 ATP-binding protein [Bacteroidota bacterium]MDP4289016.1 ATP-binding protein [Bacteroidota bacterium]